MKTPNMVEKINELLGAVAALKTYVAHLPGVAVDLEAVEEQAATPEPG